VDRRRQRVHPAEFDVQLIPDTAIDPSQSGVGVAKNFVADYGGALVGAVGGLAGAIFAVFTIALFAFYMTSNAPKIRRSVVSLLRPERQRDVLWAWNVAIERAATCTSASCWRSSTAR
jgi:predicted PurR-regulated permease PerM